MHLDVFSQTEKLGLKKVISYPKRRLRPALPKATGFPVHSFSSTRANTTLFIYLFYKGGSFSITTAPHSTILEWSVLQKGLNYSFLKKTDCFTVARTKRRFALLYWWQNHDVSNSNRWTFPEMALAGQQLCFLLFCAKLYKWWHAYWMGHPKGLCNSSFGDLFD